MALTQEMINYYMSTEEYKKLNERAMYEICVYGRISFETYELMEAYMDKMISKDTEPYTS